MMAVPLQATGLIGKLLADNGVPYAAALGSGITFFVVFIAGYLGGRLLIIPVLNRLASNRDLDAHVRKPIRRIAMICVTFVAIAIAFGLAGYGNILTSLATIAAAATLAIGFAMQDVIKNFVAGVFIYTDEPFRVGDWIEWGDYAGVVEDISFRVTRVRTFDNELLTVPNTSLTTDVVKNPVAKDTLRVTTVFGIGYDDDITAATDIILEEAAAHEDILEDPGPSVRLTDLGDSSVGLHARVWIAKPTRSDAVAVKADLATAVKRRFDEADIDIPYPQRTLTGGIDIAGSPDELEAEAVED